MSDLRTRQFTRAQTPGHTDRIPDHLGHISRDADERNPGERGKPVAGLGSADYPPLEPAPGQYVLRRG